VKLSIAATSTVTREKSGKETFGYKNRISGIFNHFNRVIKQTGGNVLSKVVGLVRP